jgi:hypothetical protein
MIQALTMAQGRCRVITPEFCVAYLRAWQADQETWRVFLSGLPTTPAAAGAFRELGLEVQEHRPHE